MTVAPIHCLLKPTKPRVVCGVKLSDKILYVPPKLAQYVTCKRCTASLRKD